VVTVTRNKVSSIRKDFGASQIKIGASFEHKLETMFRCMRFLRTVWTKQILSNKTTWVPKRRSLFHFQPFEAGKNPLFSPLQIRFFWTPSMIILAKGKKPSNSVVIDLSFLTGISTAKALFR
jgi:hypothetical protein